MSDYITISNRLLHAIGNVLVDYAGSDPTTESFTEVPVSLVESLRQYFIDGDSDDHSVGLCTCDTNYLATELGMTLEGYMTCPACGGDGSQWDQAKADEWRAANPGWDDWCAGMVDCEKCRGKGKVDISVIS